MGKHLSHNATTNLLNLYLVIIIIMINLSPFQDVWDKIGDPVLHIELRRWADILVVCPASADTMAKIVSGIADNLLLSVVRAWEFYKKPSILCPAMNTVMFEQKVTGITTKSLKEDGFVIIDPVEKRLACSDKGVGALAPVDVIISTIREQALLYYESEGYDSVQHESKFLIMPRHLRSKTTCKELSTSNTTLTPWRSTAVAVVAMAVGMVVGWFCHRESENATALLPRPRR